MVDGNIILSVAKAMELLQILSQAGKPLLLKELTALCGYPKSTVFGLLTTMRAYDVVTQTPDGRYTLGLRLFEYGRQVERSWDISTVARPYMEHLCRQTGASVMLSVCEGGSVITLDQVETRGSLRVVSDTGSRLPIYCTSQGKVFLAHMSRTGAEALLRHYAPLMRYIIAPIVPDAQDREECLSDAALRVWEKFGTYDPARGSWTAWLTALTRNTALNRARKKSGGSEELSGDLPSAEPTPEERLLQQERRQALERALTALPQRDRLLFYRKYYYRQSTAQIAAELGTTERAVEGRLYRIKELYGCTGRPNEGLRIDPVEQARRIREAEQNDPVLRGRVIHGVADPAIFDESRGESIAAMMERSPNFLHWKPGDHTRLAGKMQFHYRLNFDADGRPMLQVFNTCKHFIRTLPNLVYDESNVEDIDTRQEDHIYDECRYVLMENPISPPARRTALPPPDDPLDLHRQARFYRI